MELIHKSSAATNWQTIYRNRVDALFGEDLIIGPGVLFTDDEGKWYEWHSHRFTNDQIMCVLSSDEDDELGVKFGEGLAVGLTRVESAEE